jgi:hypothetical protein
MKRVEVFGLVFVLGLWFAFSVATAQEGSGALCVPNQNCGGGNCLTGGHANDPACAGSPNGYMCRVYANGAAQAIPYKKCVDSDDSKNCCKLAPLPPGQNAIDCGQMDYWNCGCVNGDNNCGYTACSCSGVADGQTNSFTADAACTSC